MPTENALSLLTLSGSFFACPPAVTAGWAARIVTCSGRRFKQSNQFFRRTDTLDTKSAHRVIFDNRIIISNYFTINETAFIELATLKAEPLNIRLVKFTLTEATAHKSQARQPTPIDRHATDLTGQQAIAREVGFRDRQVGALSS